MKTALFAGFAGLVGAVNHERMAAFDLTRGKQADGSVRRASRSTFPSRRHAELEAAGAEARAAAAPGIEVSSQSAAAAPARRRLQADCPDQFYVIGTQTDTRYGDHSGSFASPMEIIPGCPYSVEIVAGKAFYHNLGGMNETNAFGSLPMILFSWSVVAENGDTPLNMFSLRSQPAYAEVDAGTFYDWYYWPLLLDDVVTFREDTTGNMIDYYHCYSYCGYEASGLQNVCGQCGTTDLRTVFDTFWFSMSTYVTSETITVTNLVDIVYTNRGILASELQVIKDMYEQNCHPWNNAPAGWDWEEYQVIESDASGELDSRNKPYCDWWVGATLASVNALTTNDCLLIPGVLCDPDGHVSDMIIDTKGMRGALPSNFDDLTHLQYLELQNNRLEGPLPTHVFDSPELRKVDVYGNMFSGSVPCPSAVDPNLLELTLANNELSGIIPGCLFTDFPEMTVFDVSRNLFDTTVPTTITQASRLTALFMQHAGLTGSIESLHNLPTVGSLDVSHNFLTGEMTQAFINGMPALYRIDLSWNQLTGPLPVMGEANDGLRRIHLDHNMLTGTITDQFTTFASNQDRGAQSDLELQSNGFCGDLPEIFYTLLMDSHYFIYNFNVVQNHFRCSKEGNNKYWPNWAMSIPVDFGMCIPIPVIHAIEDSVAIIDTSLSTSTAVVLHGEFTPTTEGHCKFMFSDGTTAEVSAVFDSSVRVHCNLPMDAPEGVTSVTVAHYCQDYASAETLDDYVEITFEIQYGSLSNGSSKKKTKTDMAAVIGGVVAAVVAVIFLIFIFVMCCRERQGKPLFKPLKDTENPLYLDQQNKPADQGIDLQVKSESI